MAGRVISFMILALGLALAGCSASGSKTDDGSGQDLYVADLYASDAPVAGQPFTLRISVANAGDQSSVPTAWRLNSVGGTPVSGTIPALSPGDWIDIDVILNLPAGYWDWAFSIDPNGFAPEVLRSNNQGLITIAVAMSFAG